MTGAHIAEFRDAIRSAGMIPPDQTHDDGQLHRFSPTGKPGDDAGWYILHADGIPAGAFGDWRNGVSEHWHADVGRPLTTAEQAQHRARMEKARRTRAQEQERRHADARKVAKETWRAAAPAPSDHRYLLAKGIQPHGLRVNGERLLVLMRDSAGVVHSLQTIEPSGAKLFLPGGRVRGCYFGIGRPHGVLLICEGFATGGSLHEATGHAVAVAFNAGNLEPVARSLRQKYPDLPLVICADDDHRTAGNPGITKATAAAQAVGGSLAVPAFGLNRPEGATDFNDLMRLRGADAVRHCVASAVQVSQVSQVSLSEAAPDDWPAPQPLVARTAPEPYPVDALPAIVRAAVQEVQGFVQAPVPLVASSAIAALSVAIQGLHDVRRTEGLEGPVGVFLMTVADSGERKTACDRYFTQAISAFQDTCAAEMKDELARRAAEIEAWSAKRAGILESIRAGAKKGDDTSDDERKLGDLEADKPEILRVPKLLRGDETPERLAWSLMHEWPSAGILSSEAGTILGSHGMGNDSLMRSLARMNLLWDGGRLDIGRQTSESFAVKGARLTLGFMVQEVTLQSFFASSGGLARGTGFLARFLLAWPESTQGKRLFREPPSGWPRLARFNARITEILETSAPIGADGSLSPTMLDLSPEAMARWVEFHNAFEAELRSGGDLYDVRDVASKAAENVARLAALFHVFEGGVGPIGVDAITAAGRIVAWHLSESRRFFGELAMPPELVDASRLDAWLVDYCRRSNTLTVPRRDIQRNVIPTRLRKGEVLDRTLKELAEAGRVRQREVDRRKDVLVNAALVSGEVA